jgi:hypothetical protein
MFGLDGSALVTGTIASDAAYTESVDIESRIETLGELADIDGNGRHRCSNRWPSHSALPVRFTGRYAD